MANLRVYKVDSGREAQQLFLTYSRRPQVRIGHLLVHWTASTSRLVNCQKHLKSETLEKIRLVCM